MAAAGAATSSCCSMELKQGIRAGSVLAYYYGAMMTLGVAASTNTLQPYLLSTFLQIDPKDQGQIGANAKTLGEVATTLISGAMGLASDRFGRRAIFVLGLSLAGLGSLLLPWATSIPSMYLFTVVNVLGTATASGMMVILPGDYVASTSLGKANGFLALANGLGVTCVGIVAGKIPSWVSRTEFATPDGHGEGRVAYSVMAALALSTALLLWCCLTSAKGEGGSGGQHQERVTMAEKLRVSLRVAQKDVGVKLCFIVALVVRADGQTASLFLPQWCVSFMIQEATRTAPGGVLPDAQLVEATKQGLSRGSMLVGIIGLSAMLGGPLFGRVADSVSRVKLLGCVLLLSSLSYCLVALHSDPFGKSMLVACLVLGLSQVGTVVASGALVQQQAPMDVRGSILGMFATCGGLGQIVNVFIGGQLFSHWAMRGPFCWMCLMNAAATFACLLLQHRVKRVGDSQGNGLLSEQEQESAHHSQMPSASVAAVPAASENSSE